MPKSRKRPRKKHRGSKPWHNPLVLDRMFDHTVDRAFIREVPRLLYHYTTWAGVEGILSSQTFWATAHDCTNDEAELVSANASIIDVTKELRANTTGTTAALLDLFLNGYSNLQVAKLLTVYLACFSLARDDK